jgi:hypothetical protein
MSTSPEAAINLLSRWLAGHVGNDDLRRELAGVEPAGLGAETREVLDDLRSVLAGAGDEQRGEVDRLVRETLEALALGA